MGEERLQGFHHVGIAQIPRFDAASEHRAVILLCVAHETRVLLGEEILVGGYASIARRVLGRAAAQVHELSHGVVFARPRETDRGGVAVRLRVFTEIFEASVAVARALGRGGIDLSQITQHRFDRGVQAVEIESVESDARCGVLRAVVAVEPL